MTDEELLGYLRRSSVGYTHPLRLAADRIEALRAERDDAVIKRAAWELEAKTQKARAERLEPVAAPVMALLSDAEIASIMAEGPKGPPMLMPDPAAIREEALREALDCCTDYGFTRANECRDAILALIQKGAAK